MYPYRFLPGALLLLLAGCGGFGTVNQGQVIEYQRSTGQVTLIQDSNYRDSAHPKFDMLPPITVRTPADPTEMGPEPEAGKLLKLDMASRRIWIFNSATQQIERVEYTAAAAPSGGVSCGSPVVDRQAKTIVLCAPGGKPMAISVAEKYLDLPADTWKAGDEVRYYYKEPGQALRLMNVTKSGSASASKS